MEIEFLEKSFLPFADLKIGDIFCRKGYAYMKTNAPNVPCANVAVNLHDGRTEFFDSDDMVKKFDNAKLCLG